MAGKGMNGTNTSSGSFGIGPNAPTLCGAKSKRSRVQCEGPAIAGTDPPRCRMHGGSSLRGRAVSSFQSGRHSKYLPSQLDALYREALSNPDLLEMSDHIALLEARIQDVLARSAGGDPVPQWKEMAEAFEEVETAILGGEPDNYIKALERMHKLLDAGKKWDTTWHQVMDTMEQLRRMTDTEVKRKKELHQMVPVERVMILIAAVGMAVKRHVSNPDEIQAVYNELATLHGNGNAPGGQHRAGPEVINVSPETRGISGGTSKMALQRKARAERKRLEAAQAQGAILVGIDG